VSRFARNASVPYAPSGVACAQLAASICFRLTRLLVLRASPDAGCRRVELAFASDDRQMQMDERIGADDVPMVEAVGN
jgi:hypothetical protein